MVPGDEIEFIDPSAHNPTGGGWGLRVDVGEQGRCLGKRTQFNERSWCAGAGHGLDSEFEGR